MKESLKIAFVFIGTIIGAGLASGQEILQFFSMYGIYSIYGIILCMFVYIISSIVIIELCFRYNLRSYKDMVFLVLGRKSGKFVDLILTFFIFAGNTIIISGGSAMLNEYMHINKAISLVIMSILILIIGMMSTKGVIATNSIIVPMSTCLITVLGIMVFKSHIPLNNVEPYISSFPVFKKDWVISSVVYACFNLMTAAGVLCPMTQEMRNKKHFTKGCILGSIVLTLIALIINFSILIYYPKSFYSEIPNLYISRYYGNFITLFLTIVIWLEMFSTEIGDIYSLSKRLEYSLNISYIKSAILVVIVSVPFSFIGFSNLIRILYPPYGFISMIFMIGCFYRFIIFYFKKAR